MDKSAIVDKVKDILVGVLKHENFEMKDEVTASEIKGWDSLSHMIIITEIEKAFSIRFRLKELNKLNNMGALLDLIQAKSQ